MLAEVGAVFGGAVEEIKPECLAVEDAGVFGKKAKENANQKAFELMSRVAACFQRVVQAAHDFDRFKVDRVLFLELVLLVAGDECEGVDVFVEISQREFDGSHAPVAKEWEMSLVFVLKVVQGNAGKVRTMT